MVSPAEALKTFLRASSLSAVSGGISAAAGQRIVGEESQVPSTFGRSYAK
jgi:hypothetical protein